MTYIAVWSDFVERAKALFFAQPNRVSSTSGSNRTADDRRAATLTKLDRPPDTTAMQFKREIRCTACVSPASWLKQAATHPHVATRSPLFLSLLAVGVRLFVVRWWCPLCVQTRYVWKYRPSDNEIVLKVTDDNTVSGRSTSTDRAAIRSAPV